MAILSLLGILRMVASIYWLSISTRPAKKLAQLLRTNVARVGSKPAITNLKDGGFLITWDSTETPSDQGIGVFAQRFDINCKKVGNNFK